MKTKVGSLKNINKIDKSLTRIIQNKRRLKLLKPEREVG